MTERTPHKDDRTIDLALGLLSKSEEADAIDAIAPDQSAEEDLVEATARRESARGSAPPHAMPGAPDTKTADRKGGRAKRRSPFPILGALAAASIAFVLIRMFAPGASGPSIQPIAVPDEMNRLRGAQSSGEALSNGLAAYENGSYEDAVLDLGEARAVGATEVVRLVYLASAHNQIGDHDKAIAILADMPFGAIPDPWGAEALDNLIFALRETGQDTRADEFLERFGSLEETSR